MGDEGKACRNLYAFIRLCLGEKISDREIARRWRMEWKSFSGLRHGKRQVPRIAELEELARILGVDAAPVFEVARGVPAGQVHRLLHARRHQSGSREQQYRAVMDRIGEAIFTMDIQGRFQEVNRRASDLTGYSAPELAGMSLFDLLPAGQRPALVDASAAVYKSAAPDQTSFTIRTKQGAERAVELGLTRIDDSEGNAIGIQGIARDVTERRALEAELKQQYSTLRMTFDAAPAAALLFARDGAILLANRLLEKVCQWTAEEVVGRNAFEIFGSPGPKACPVTRAFETGQLEQQISILRNKAGQEVHVHRTAGPVLGEDGRVDKVVEILVDVTDQVRRGDAALLDLMEKQRLQEGAPDAERRRFMRAPLDTGVVIQLGERLQHARGMSVSRGGIHLQTDAQVAVGTTVSLEWELPGRPGKLRATGEVVYQRRTGRKKTPVRIGIRFAEVTPSTRESIVRYVLSAPTEPSRTRRRGS